MAKIGSKEAQAWFDDKALITSWEGKDFAPYHHVLAFTVAKMTQLDMLAEVKKGLSEALANGTTAREFQKNLKPYLQSRGWWGVQEVLDPNGQPVKALLGSDRRLKQIFELNTQSAYMAGRWERIQKNKALLPFLKYLPSHAKKQRHEHKAYYGLVLPVDSPFWLSHYPPNGYACKCNVVAITRSQAERSGISPEPDLSKEINTVEPSFQHNIGDRLGAINKLIEKKHGTDARILVSNETRNLITRLAKTAEMRTVSFKNISIDEAEVQRLGFDPQQKKLNRGEGEASSQWQNRYQERLERYDLPNQNPPDLFIADQNKPKEQWTTIDFMYTVNNDHEAELMNKHFANNHKVWLGKKRNIDLHLEKADIVPMDIRHLTTENYVKLTSYLLSLPLELRRKITLIME